MVWMPSTMGDRTCQNLLETVLHMTFEMRLHAVAPA